MIEIILPDIKLPNNNTNNKDNIINNNANNNAKDNINNINKNNIKITTIFIT